MSIKESLTYQFKVNAEEHYSIKIRIGDAQDGDHNVFGNCPYSTPPENNNPEWISYLGKGLEIVGKVLFISSATQDNNPNTNRVSVWLFINDQQVLPLTGENELVVADRDIAYFNQQLDFI